MKRYLFITILQLTLLPAGGQVSVTDSLVKKMHESKEDTARVRILCLLSNELELSNPDSAYELALQGVKLAKKINDTRGELYCISSAGASAWSLGDYSTAVRWVLPRIKQAERINDPWLLTSLYSVLINSYRDQQDYHEALKYAFKADKVVKYVKHCKFCKINKAAIGSIFLGKGNLDSSKHYLQTALQYPASPGFDGWIYSMAGKVYTALKKNDSAFFFYRQSIATLLLENNLKDLADAYINISVLFKKAGQIDSALYYTRKSLLLSNQKNFARELMAANLVMSQLYEETTADSSLYYFKKAMAAKDSLYSQEKQRQILSYKFSDDLLLLQIQEMNVRQRNQYRMFAVVGFAFFFLVISFLLFRNNQQKQKAYTLLKKQKEETDIQKTKAENALEELKSTQSQLVKSEKEKLQAHYNKKLLELESLALRAQMNPHFIFNCMNSIKSLINKNENEKAVSYLATFSKLIRTLFQNADKREVSLHEELETCRLYTQLERMRFGNKVDFDFDTDNSIDLKDIKVPALILQPIIENAIWHGLVPKGSGGKVTIVITQYNGAVECTIDDNGIGRELSAQYKTQNAEAYQSRGIGLTQSRLEIDKILNEREDTILVIDKRDENGQPAGTKVVLTFKEK